MGQYKQTRGCSAAPAAGFFWDAQKETKKPPRGVFGGKRAFWRGGAQVRLMGSQAGEDTRSYEMRGPSGLAVGADDLGGPRAHTVRPYGRKRTGSVGSANSGAEAGPHQKYILRTQGPSGSGADSSSQGEMAPRRAEPSRRP